MELKRYHEKIFLPLIDVNKFLNKAGILRFTTHAMKRIKERNDIYQNFIEPTKEALAKSKIVEAYFKGNAIEKVVFRIKGTKSDWCFVVARNGAILTSWACKPSNQYQDIDYSVYDKEFKGRIVY